MQTIKDTPYYTMHFDDENKIIIVDWHSNIEELEEEEYKKILDEVHAKFYDFQPKGLLHNSRDFAYPMTESLQEYIKENYSKKVLPEVGIKKVAYVFPDDILTKLGLELMVDKIEGEVPDILRRFFDNKDDAYKWLKH